MWTEANGPAAFAGETTERTPLFSDGERAFCNGECLCGAVPAGLNLHCVVQIDCVVVMMSQPLFVIVDFQ